jgi:uncharacterized protein (TIGR02246 family)
MRHVIAILTCLAILAAAEAARADTAADEAAIQEVLASFRKSWDTPGMPGLEALFTEDADFVVVTGRWLQGRDEVVRYHRELLQTFYAGSRTLPWSIGKVRFLTPDLAITHVASGARYTRDGIEHVRTGLATAVLAKQNGKWLITAFHNTLTGGPGALAPGSSK